MIAFLDPDPSTFQWRHGPDNPPDFVVDPNLHIYVDTLDSRSNNRYFYRACCIDGAHNRSVLSLSRSIWLPNVVPPKRRPLPRCSPAQDSAVAGRRKITSAVGL